MAAVIKSCTCISKYQDEKYGKNMRVHSTQHGKNAGKVRCTVCGTSKSG